MIHQHETKFAVVEHWPENAAGLEEGYNRAFLSQVKSLHDAFFEAENAANELRCVPGTSEFDYVTVVCPQWYLGVLQSVKEQEETFDDNVPF